MEPLSITSPFYHKHGPYRATIQRFAEGVSGRVLDVGCGDRPYQELFDVDEADYIGVDISSDAETDLYADGMSLPFKADSFDYVLSNQVVEHVPDPFQFFEEVARVVKPGGQALITTAQAYFLHGKPHDYFRFTRYGLRTVASRAGLEPQRILETGTTTQHMCAKIGVAFRLALPSPLDAMGVALTNILFWPIQDFDLFEDYYITGIVVEQPSGPS